MRQSCRAGQPVEPSAETEPHLPSPGLSTCRGLAILLLPLPGSPSTFPIRIPGTSAVPELGCRLPWRDTCVICKCQASFQKFLHKVPKIPRTLMGVLSRGVWRAQGEGEGLCRAHMGCEADHCQGLEQMHLPWLLQPGSTWPPVASWLCTGHEAPGTAPGPLNLLSDLGDPTSPDPTGPAGSRPQIPPSMQMTLMETRGLPQAHSRQDLLEKWLPEVSHHYLPAPSRVLLPLQPPHALLEHQVPGSPRVLLWLKSHGESPTLLVLALCPRAPALLVLQPTGFCQGMQEGPYMSLLLWRQYPGRAQAHHLPGIWFGLMTSGQDGC